LISIGQIYKDNDRRAEGKRKLRVTRIFLDDMIECEVFISGKSTGRKTKISADRFKIGGKGKGYTLVSDPAPRPPENVPIMFGG